MSYFDDMLSITSAFKRYHPIERTGAFSRKFSQAFVGHWVEHAGTWNSTGGFTADYASFKYDDTITPYYTACALVFTTTEHFRENDVTLTFTVRTCKRKKDAITLEEEYTEETINGATISRPDYEHDAITTVDLTIPAWTRPGVSFQVGSISTIYQLDDVVSDVILPGGGAGEIHALASVGAKMLFGMSYHKLMEDVDTISNALWISPPFCHWCNGDGSIDGSICPVCNGFGYAGSGAVEYLATNKGKEVGISKSDSDSFERYQHEVWAQKWWVTPTRSDITRVFAHFCNIPEDEIIIQESYDDFEPSWTLLLPTGFGAASKFDYSKARDRDALQALLESTTPAGVEPFITWYSNAGEHDEVTAAEDLYIIHGSTYHTRTTFPSATWGTPWFEMRFETGALGTGHIAYKSLAGYGGTGFQW